MLRLRKPKRPIRDLPPIHRWMYDGDVNPESDQEGGPSKGCMMVRIVEGLVIEKRARAISFCR